MSASDSRSQPGWTFDRTGILLLAATLIPLGALAIAWGIELIGGIAPCPLCLTQRIPYYAGLPVALLGLWLYRRSKARTSDRSAAASGAATLAFLLFALAMAVAAGYGIYHAGVEYGVWQGPTACSGAGPTPETVEDLLNQLGEVQPVNCGDVPVQIIGLSLAAWNAIITGTAMILALVGAWRIAQGKRS
jgi:disulfide bond formation protein DsbB